MNEIRRIALVLLVTSGLLAAPQSSGQFYAGGSFGKSDFDDGNAIPDLMSLSGSGLPTTSAGM